MRFLPLLLVVVLSGCITLPTDTSRAERVDGPNTAPSASADYSGLPAEFGGNVTVTAGVDVQPGTYLVEAVLDTCEWVKGVDGDVVASGQNDVVLEAGETVETYGCSVFVKAD